MPNNAKNPLRVLILEDRAEDAELLLHELRKAGFTVDARRVEDEDGFRACLNADVDIILADYALPGYNAFNALHSLQESGLDIPFIIVTGALSDEDAAACIKRGADDYLRKDRVARLGHAVAAALDQRHLRAEHRAMEQSLRANEQKYRLLFNKIHDPVFVVEVPADGRFGCMLEANDAACLRLGYARQALLKLTLQDIAAPDRARILKLVAGKIMADNSLSFDTELAAKNGERIPVDMFLNRIDLNGKPAIMAIARDMSEIRKLEQKIYEIDEME
ncbi:MAG: PAS domain S-box protein, partial [Kiritimatiellota bacterium]|nr:PAS domain S-box protein [Kiritimatiellota bacterium]